MSGNGVSTIGAVRDRDRLPQEQAGTRKRREGLKRQASLLGAESPGAMETPEVDPESFNDFGGAGANLAAQMQATTRGQVLPFQRFQPFPFPRFSFTAL